MDADATAHASGLAMNVGPCMTTPASLAEIPRATASVVSTRRGSGSRPSVPCRGRASEVTSSLAERVAGALEAGGDLVEDQQQAVLVGDLAEHRRQAAG